MEGIWFFQITVDDDKISVFALTTISLFCAHARAADKVRVSVTNYNMSYLAAGVAAKRGFFKEEGLDVEIIRMNANVAMSALISRECDYTMIFASVIRAAMRGIPLKVIAVLIDSPPYAFIARPEIDQLKALKGKTIGIGVFRQLQRRGCAHDAGALRHRSRQRNQTDRLRFRRRALRRTQRRAWSTPRSLLRRLILKRASSVSTFLPAPTIFSSFRISASAPQ